MDYGNTKIAQHALEVLRLHNAEVGHYTEEEETGPKPKRILSSDSGVKNNNNERQVYSSHLNVLTGLDDAVTFHSCSARQHPLFISLSSPSSSPMRVVELVWILCSREQIIIRQKWTTSLALDLASGPCALSGIESC